MASVIPSTDLPPREMWIGPEGEIGFEPQKDWLAAKISFRSSPPFLWIEGTPNEAQLSTLYQHLGVGRKVFLNGHPLEFPNTTSAKALINRIFSKQYA